MAGDKCSESGRRYLWRGGGDAEGHGGYDIEMREHGSVTTIYAVLAQALLSSTNTRIFAWDIRKSRRGCGGAAGGIGWSGGGGARVFLGYRGRTGVFVMSQVQGFGMLRNMAEVPPAIGWWQEGKSISVSKSAP